MKRFKIRNILTFTLLVFFAYKQIPVMMDNFKSEGTKLLPRPFLELSTEDGPVFFPPNDKKVIAIFWASWCGPCKVEMARLKSSVEKGNIPKESIFAINPFESRTEVMNFISENHYPFSFIEAPDLLHKLNIQVTPTTLFIENGIITSRSSGMSIFGIWRAEIFI